ncbi:hypothetical protein HUU42_03525 [bacterium]|nr:hypothetical protein [bacterium]
MLTELMIDLYRGLNDREPGPEIVASIRGFQEDNGLLNDHNVPEWLTSVFKDALAKRGIKNVLFQQIGSDISTFLDEVSTVIPGWKHHDEGEWVEIVLEQIGVKILLSREARTLDGKGCSSYSVELLNK